MQKANYHTHTHYSDGTSPPEIYIEKAIELNFNSIGISDHAPIPRFGKKWNMDMDDLSIYIDHLSNLKNIYKHKIKVLTSLEIDYIPNVINPKYNFILQCNLDYTIGSIHYLGHLKQDELIGFELFGQELINGLYKYYKGNVYKMVEAYYKNVRDMVQFFTPDIVGHLDKIKNINTHQFYFDENENWYQNEIKETLNAIAEKKIVLEVNTKDLHTINNENPYPSYWILEIANKKNIPIVLSSDAHNPQFLNFGFDDVMKKLNDIGFTKLAQF